MSDAREWDDAADSFDDAPDHGLRDPDIRAAWRRLLLRHLSPAPGKVLDVGCGTGTLAVLLASVGYAVTGLDVSRRMLAQATEKADREHVSVSFVYGDAAEPPVSGPFDVVLCRHVLWALPEPENVLEKWRSLLRPGGQLILIEGLWSTGGGISPSELLTALGRVAGSAAFEPLTDAALWGRAITDERYLVVATV